MEQDIRFCTAADGVRIAYATCGAGYPIVKAPNWLNHIEFDWESPVWRHVFRELSSDHLLVRFDQRGNGLSDWDAEDLSFEAWVTDLETVVEATRLERFALLGISQGGAVSVEYARRHPGRVSHIIMLGAFSRGWNRRSTPEGIEIRRAMTTLMKRGWGQDNPAFRQMWTSLFVPAGTPTHQDWFNELQRRTTSPDNAARLISADHDVDIRPVLPQLNVPTLILHAREDAVCPFSQGRELASLIPGARLVPLESKNHLLLEEEPAFQVFVSEVRRFLGDAPTADRHTTARPTIPPTAPGFDALGPGSRLGHYEVTAAIGAGGMGEVYRARDTKLGREVAIKVLPHSDRADPSARARLLREARHAAALNHPSICVLHEISEATGRDFIVMELVDRQTLSQLLVSGGLDHARIVDYGCQMAEALEHAHGRGVVHRDLKSANVAITDGGRVKILDFGIARRLPTSDMETVTQSQLSIAGAGNVAGTLAYMSPEVLRGERADARSDLWSLGVLLFEMVTGRLPFSGQTGFDLTSAILRDTPKLPRKGLPARLRAVIQRCLEKDPASRYQQAGEVRSAMAAVGTTRKRSRPRRSSREGG